MPHDMTQAERCARLASAYSPEDYPLNPNPAPLAHDHDRLERRLAVTFAVLAAVAVAVGIWWGLA